MLHQITTPPEIARLFHIIDGRLTKKLYDCDKSQWIQFLMKIFGNKQCLLLVYTDDSTGDPLGYILLALSIFPPISNYGEILMLEAKSKAVQKELVSAAKKASKAAGCGKVRILDTLLEDKGCWLGFVKSQSQVMELSCLR